MTRYLSPRDIDWTVLLIVLLICGVGVLQIYSATRDTDYTSAWWKQILYVVGGLFLMWLVDGCGLPQHAALRAGAVYRKRGGALGVTYLVGEKAYGSRRVDSGGVRLHLQVSEFVKLVIILLVARYLTESAKR